MKKRPRLDLVIITGLSGAGRSTSAKCLEDLGWYVVDNLPPSLIATMADLAGRSQGGVTRVAAVVDVRSRAFTSDLQAALDDLDRRGQRPRVLFLEASDDALVRRYSETRRRHPLSESGLTLPESIARERELLAELATLGHHVDTSDLSPNSLRTWVKDFVGLSGAGLTLLFESFGFKNGIPLDADLVFDARCLPNPNYDPKLRPFTGRDQPVVDFLDANTDTQRMREDIRRFVESWLPCFKSDNRSYLTVAIGCTGGRHRSVYLVEVLAGYFRRETPVLIRHRELS
jgi:UPF0042 nucleotide-binding protein